MKKLSASKINVRRYLVWAILAWTVSVGILFGLYVDQERRQVLEFAGVQARSALNKDLVYRRWNASHGGVYVPVTAETQPNPYLDVPNRDITTTTGLKLTLINPAYMTRQVHEMSQAQYDERGHITSLNPIRPQNAPDAWETKALKSFETGATEVSEVEPIGEVQYLRLMIPLLTEASCLKCHAVQGYKVGDIRGGLSVSVPLTSYLASYRANVWRIMVGYGLLWVLGLAGIFAAGNRIGWQMQEREQVEATLRESTAKLETLIQVSPLAIILVDLSGKIQLWNASAERIFGWTAEEVIGQPNPMVPEDKRAECAVVTQGGGLNDLETVRLCKDGSLLNVSISSAPMYAAGAVVGRMAILTDITGRKQADEALRRSELRERERATELQTIMDTVPAMVSIAHDRNCELVTGSRTVYATLRMPEQSNTSLTAPAGQGPAHFKIYINGLELPPEKLPLQICASTGVEIREVEEEIVFEDGEVVSVFGNVVPLLAEDGQPRGAVAAFMNITDRKRAEAALRASLTEKEVLLKEVHHRVKNNLQIIFSLLDMQSDTSEDAQIVQALQESKNRVQVMALVHEKLYRSENMEYIQAAEYIPELLDHLEITFSSLAGNVSFETQIEDLTFNINIAIPCGMIITELVTNALKYAFPSHAQGTIKVYLEAEAGQVTLLVSDDGIGLPGEIDLQAPGTVGLELVSILVSQLKGTLQVIRAPGTTFRITFSQ
jgi:PAS domain S-box-containing protein